LAELASQDGGRSYQATLALLEVGQEVIPELEQLLDDPNAIVRYRAANILRGLSSRGAKIAAGVLDKAKVELAE
jgi:HEAT repeat protein